MLVLVADKMEPEVVRDLAALEDIGEQNLIYCGDQSLPLERLPSIHTLVVRSATKVTAELIARMPALVLVARAGVGLDNVDLIACQARRIEVINTPDASTEAVAQFAFLQIMNGFRHVPVSSYDLHNGKWSKTTSTEPGGKVLGVIGYGRIGKRVAQFAKFFGMNILAYDPYLAPDQVNGFATLVRTLEELLSRADAISLHANSNVENHNLINADTIGLMKDGVVLVNTARGSLIDEAALFNALVRSKIGYAALDVFKEEPYSGPLVNLRNAYLTPHIAASTKEAQLRIGEELIRKFREFCRQRRGVGANVDDGRNPRPLALRS